MKVKLSKRTGVSLFLSLTLTLSAGPLNVYAAGPSSGPAGAVLSVADFGANGADALDDRAGIQAAIDAAQAGDTVLLPKGVYDLSGTVKGKSGVTIKGENRDGTIVKYTGGADTYMFYFLNVTKAAIKNLTLDGNNSTSSCRAPCPKAAATTR